MSWEALHGKASLLFAAVAILVAGCGHKPDSRVANQLEESGKSSAFHTVSPLLDGLRADDIARAQASVKKHVLPHWSVIAERSIYVRQRIVAVLAEMEAPPMLQTVPVIESGYNPYALSYVGAMGLWQIMPRTGRSLGLLHQNGRDERRSIEASTRGATAYLLKLKERFGCWPLAFAAYHLGPSAVSRRLRKTPWHPADGLNRMPVPLVTRTYVMHIIGMAALLEMRNIRFPQPIPTRAVILAAPADLEQLAFHSGLDSGDLFRFNPGLDYRQYLKEQIVIHVPEEAAAAVEQARAEIKPDYVNVAVRPGDSLWKMAHRHDTSVQHLKQLNPGLGSVLSVDQQVKVPANQLARATPQTNPMLSQGRRIRYKVRPGDSLWVIAKRFGTTVMAIARSNQLSLDTLIRPGDTLWVLARIRPS